MMRLSLLGVMVTCVGVVREMVSSGGGGQVVIISSLQGKLGIPLRTSCKALLTNSIVFSVAL